MSASHAKTFNLPWNQHPSYSIVIAAKHESLPGQVEEDLRKVGMTKIDDRHGMSVIAPQDWKPVWNGIYDALGRISALDLVYAYITPGARSSHVTALDRRSTAEMQELSESLWLGDAIIAGRVMCYLQPVVTAKGDIFGYESFARVADKDGGIISGDRIVAASKALGVQNMIDRHLHVQAIKTFNNSNFNGFLFINFFPGFIQRPELYLEGLSETVRNQGVIAKHIVLDFTKMEAPRDFLHISKVCDYGRTQGYSVAVDDISSLESAQRLVKQIRPDFLKIDMQLIRRAEDSAAQNVIRDIVELVHSAGGAVIAEGVETEKTYELLKGLRVDLFQGYLFGQPLPVEAAITRKKA